MQKGATMKKLFLSGLFALAAAASLSSSALADHWTRQNGRWYMWNDADSRYYYNDGQNWFYSGDKGWNTYKFDRKFGNDWEIERDKLKFDDDIAVPTYPVPAAPAVRTKTKVKVEN